MLACETAIAESLGRQLSRSDAPSVSKAAVEAALAATEASLGAQLSEERCFAATAICTSGRGAELVEGVAGAGKTTMLKVVAAGFSEAGFEVLGTATSGQAARNLTHEAEIGASRTLASLLWRLDHRQLSVSDETVMICDEVGMTDDADLVRLGAYVENAGAKLILVGDHHQLGAVGPGGALGALVSRHPEAVHHLAENRRQYDPDERQALAALRDGEVSTAISFYRGHDRIHIKADRADALQAAVDAWSADVADGHETRLYAWRRANVAELNALARASMESAGRLSGPEVLCPGGNAYRAGDEVVTLAPGRGGTLVTSERAVVQAVEPGTGSLYLRTRDGREVRLSREEASADRLGYGYSTTVHRSQGETVSRAHLFADGGGRELAYVAMSRARESTHAFVVADDLAQGAEDLRRDWSAERTPTWAIDTGLPDRESLTRETVAELAEEERVRVAALVLAETRMTANAIGSIRPADLAPALAEARVALRQAEQARVDLKSGWGIYQHTEAGQAVVDLAEAKRGLFSARTQAEYGTRWRDRRAGAKKAATWAGREKDAEERWQTHGAPEAARLASEIERHRAVVERLTARREAQAAASRLSVERRWSLQCDAHQLAVGLDSRRDKLDGVPRPTPRRPPGQTRKPRVPNPTPQREPVNRPRLGM